MYNVDAYIKSLTSNAVKLSKKVQDGIVENTRDLRFENQAHFLDTNEDKMRQVDQHSCFFFLFLFFTERAPGKYGAQEPDNRSMTMMSG
jgi:hypothetical protein